MNCTPQTTFVNGINPFLPEGYAPPPPANAHVFNFAKVRLCDVEYVLRDGGPMTARQVAEQLTGEVHAVSRCIYKLRLNGAAEQVIGGLLPVYKWVQPYAHRCYPNREAEIVLWIQQNGPKRYLDVKNHFKTGDISHILVRMVRKRLLAKDNVKAPYRLPTKEEV